MGMHKPPKLGGRDNNCRYNGVGMMPPISQESTDVLIALVYGKIK